MCRRTESVEFSDAAVPKVLVETCVCPDKPATEDGPD